MLLLESKKLEQPVYSKAISFDMYYEDMELKIYGLELNYNKSR